MATLGLALAKLILFCRAKAILAYSGIIKSMIEVRIAKIADIDELHMLGRSVSEFSVNDETVTFWPKDILLNVVGSEDVLIYVAHEAELMVGFILATYSHSLGKATIENIYVIPKLRGQNVGNKLLGMLEEHLAQRGCQYIATLVPANAAGALGMYSQSGFSKGNSFVWIDKTLSVQYKKP